ncbi:MAG: Zn-dependent dipeptidase, partial [Brevundimonas sp.]
MRMDRRAFVSGLALMAGAGCATVGSGDIAARARRLYARATVINGNLVAPLDDAGPLDAETAALVRASGLTAAKVTIGGPGTETRAEVRDSVAAYAKAVEMSDGLYSKITRDADFDTAKAAGSVGLIFSFEAGEMLEGDLDAIDAFRALDVMVMGLSYNRNTPFASGVMSTQPTGLTPLGRQAVERMNARGVTLDISHSDEASSLSAVAASTQPVLITHAGCAAVHAHPRNKSDRLMKALADKGGVMGLYELAYLTTPGQPTLEVYMAHLLHALNVCGEDHVGIG